MTKQELQEHAKKYKYSLAIKSMGAILTISKDGKEFISYYRKEAEDDYQCFGSRGCQELNPEVNK